MRKNYIPFILLVLVNVVWNVFLYLNPDKQTVYNYLFNIAYSSIFIYGASVAFHTLKNYSLSTPIGKSLLFYTISLSLYTLGMFAWTYYNLILKVEVPYPGIPDLFFVLFQPFSLLSFYFLVKSYGSTFTLPRLLELGVLSLVLFFILYSFLKTTSLGEELSFLTRILNITYPLFDALLAGLAIIGLRTEKGALHPNLLVFVFAALAMVFADTAFSNRSATGTYWNGGISDTAYAISATLFTFGLINLAARLKNERAGI